MAEDLFQLLEYIDTDINSNLTQDDKIAIVEEIPLCRAGMPQDVANAVAWLISDKASYVTGQVLSVNGGLLWWQNKRFRNYRRLVPTWTIQSLYCRSFAIA